MSVHNLDEYHFAKVVVKEIPEILTELEKAQNNLYQYSHYETVSDVLWAINEAKILLDIHYLTYKSIYDKKGQK